MFWFLGNTAGILFPGLVNTMLSMTVNVVCGPVKDSQAEIALSVVMLILIHRCLINICLRFCHSSCLALLVSSVSVFPPPPPSSSSSSLAGNSRRLTWARHSSRKSSATHSYHCVQYFRVSKQWYNCQCLGFLTCAQKSRNAVAHKGLYGHRKRVCTGSRLWEKNPLPNWGHEPASVLRLAFSIGRSTNWAIPVPPVPPPALPGAVLIADSKHWFTTSFLLEVGAGKRCLKCVQTEAFGVR